MGNENFDFETILANGKRLNNAYQAEKNSANCPILYDGSVYKLFLQSPKKKEKVLLQLF